MDNKEQLQRLRQINRNLIIEKLVRDENRRQILENRLLDESEIVLSSDCFVLLMLDILDYTPGKLDIDLRRETDRDAALHSIVEQLFVSRFGVDFHAYSFLCDGQSYILLNLHAADDYLSQGLLSVFPDPFTEVCKECIKTAWETYGIVIRVYISEMIDSPDGLGIAKQHLDLMLADDYIGEKSGAVFTADEMKKAMLSSNAITGRLHTLIRRILDLSQKRKFKEAGLATIEMIRLESRQYGSAAGSRQRLEGLITVLYAVMDIPYYSENSFTPDIHDVIHDIQSCLSIGDLSDYVQQLFQSFEKHYSETSKSKQGRIEDIVGYINSNYNNPLLSASMISEHFDINQSYLSRLFKDKCNEKMIDYIHKTRIHHAKALLANTTENLDVIAGKVGYENTLTFSRAFKRYEGVTPGAFRRIGYR